MKATITARVCPTEDEARVAKAITNLFPGAVLERESQGWRASTQDLRFFRRRIREMRILDATRGQLRLTATTGTLRITKAAALAGHVSLAPAPHVLGDLVVQIEHDPMDAVVSWLCPETRDGEIVGLDLPEHLFDTP